MKRFLLDLNVLLDVLLDREPWADDASRAWEICSDGRAKGFVAAHSIPTMFYIARKSAGADRAFQLVRRTLATFELCPLDLGCLVRAASLPGRDFEDNVPLVCAENAQAEGIVTRDVRFAGSSIVEILSPADLVRRVVG